MSSTKAASVGKTPARVIREVQPRIINTKTDTRDILAHAMRETKKRGLDDYFIVDVDAHHVEEDSWSEILDYLDDPVMRSYADSCQLWDPPGSGLLPGTPGMRFQDVAGRIPHQAARRETVEDTSVHRDVTLSRRAMDSMGINNMVLFPQNLLLLGLHQQPDVEVALSFAYNRWLTEKILPQEPRLKALIYLPACSPEACIKTIEEFGETKGVVGFSIVSVRNLSIHRNAYMPMLSMLEERGYPLCFHAAHNWGDSAMRLTDRFISMHALSFVLCNMVHLTNWLVHGLPERFPKLKPIWIESGLAWLPFMMQRLDNEFLMRPSEAPLLKRRPSEYIKEMYFSTQPIETTDMALLESTLTAINAETQLLYSSDWPHWDFDLPNTILDIPFLTDQAKRNILGENARRVFNLPG